MKDYPTFIKHHKTTYVIQMGWSRWGDAAKYRYMIALRRACRDTVQAINAEIVRRGWDGINAPIL